MSASLLHFRFIFARECEIVPSRGSSQRKGMRKQSGEGLLTRHGRLCCWNRRCRELRCCTWSLLLGSNESKGCFQVNVSTAVCHGCSAANRTSHTKDADSNSCRGTRTWPPRASMRLFVLVLAVSMDCHKPIRHHHLCISCSSPPTGQGNKRRNSMHDLGLAFGNGCEGNTGGQCVGGGPSFC